MVLANVAEIVAATALPLNADFQAGCSPTPEGVADNVQAVRPDRCRRLVHRGFDRRRALEKFFAGK
jgi:hypothetical protein